MKKVLIANNNMKIGGVQKSLYNLLWELHGKYDITVFLFAATGEYIEQLPSNVKVIESSSPMKFLGISQEECETFWEKLTRGYYAAISKLFGRTKAIKKLLEKEPMLSENYDVAISFLHNGSRKMFYGGVNEFVLQKTTAGKKIAFLHCDYENAGCNYEENNELYESFDAIAACSNGCRDAFLKAVPQLESKTLTVRNFHRIDEIKTLASKEPVQYDKDVFHIVTVSRLSKNKGIERGLAAVFHAIEKGFPIQYHIVGDGGDREYFQQQVKERNLETSIHFYGNTGNPYKYMKSADLLLLSSFHEAAPMVIDESRVLALPILSTETTSVKEMIEEAGAGWVCKNTEVAITEKLEMILHNEEIICEKKKEMRQQVVDNQLAIRQWGNLLEDDGQ